MVAPGRGGRKPGTFSPPVGKRVAGLSTEAVVGCRGDYFGGRRGESHFPLFSVMHNLFPSKT